MHPGPSASIAGNKLSVRTTAEELNRRKATVYIHPIFAPCRLNIQPGVRINLLEFPFGSTRNIVSLLNSRTLSRGPEVGAVEQIRFGHDAEHRIDRRFAGPSRCVAEKPAEFVGSAARVSLTTHVMGRRIIRPLANGRERYGMLLDARSTGRR